MKFIPKILSGTPVDRSEESQRALIRREAQVGGTLFGPIPAGHERQFFCLDQHTWVWHESWKENGQDKVVTTRYDVRPSGVIKSQNGQSYQRLSLQEARNLFRAVTMYERRILPLYGYQAPAR